MEKKFDWMKVIWMLVGLAVAILLVVFNVVAIAIDVVIIVGLPFLAGYAYEHKVEMKEKLKSLVDKI